MKLSSIVRSQISIIALNYKMEPFLSSVKFRAGNNNFPALATIEKDKSPQFLIDSRKILDGLKDGMLWAGMTTVVCLEMFRATFDARCFTIKLPNPLKYTFSFLHNDSRTFSIKDSITALTSFLSIPVFSETCLIISAFVIVLLILVRNG